MILSLMIIGQDILINLYSKNCCNNRKLKDKVDTILSIDNIALKYFL
jgi:hypothetical protein